MIDIQANNVGKGYTLSCDIGVANLDLSNRTHINCIYRFIKSLVSGDDRAVEYYTDYYVSRGLDSVTVKIFRQLAEEVVGYYRDYVKGDVRRLKNESKSISVLKEYLGKGGMNMSGAGKEKGDTVEVKKSMEDDLLSSGDVIDDDTEIVPADDGETREVSEMVVREVKKTGGGVKKKVPEQKVPLKQISVPPHVLTLYEEAVRNGYDGTLEQFITESIERAAEVDFGLNVAVIKTLSGRNKDKEIVVGKSSRRFQAGREDADDDKDVVDRPYRSRFSMDMDPDLERMERELERRRRQLELLRKQRELEKMERQIYGDDGVGTGMQEFLKKFEDLMKENAELKERIFREENEKRFQYMKAEIEGLKQAVQMMVQGASGGSTKAQLKAAVVSDISRTVSTVQDLVNMFAKEVILPKLRKDMELMSRVMEKNVEGEVSSGGGVEPAGWTERDEAMRLQEYYELARILGIELPEGVTAQEANKIIQSKISGGIVSQEEVKGNGE